MDGQHDPDDSSTPPRMHRVEDVDFHVADSGVGWAELVVQPGDTESRIYGFSLVFDPLESIRVFDREVADKSASRLLLRGEPGAVEIVAEPGDRDGWLKVDIWLVDHAGNRELDLVFTCPAEALLRSLRTKSGFLAKEHAKQRKQERQGRSLWRRLSDSLFQRAGKGS